MSKYLITFLVILTLSCTKSRDEAYFGGEIVNPRAPYVYLSYGEERIDSALLNEQGRFLFTIKDPKNGVYTFEHNPEYQHVLLEKGDSVMMRLNTMDFDESLIFSGIGATKNNFLIDMWLLSEDEASLRESFYKLNPAEFRKKIDSLHQMKLDQYTDLINENSLSDKAERLTKASIDFPHYLYLEKYPYKYKKYKFNKAPEEFSEIPKDFYTYHDNIDVNDSLLAHYVPYRDYLTMYFTNVALEYCKKHCDAHERFFNSSHYGIHKLKVIDSMVNNTHLEEHLFKNTATSYFMMNHDPENNQRFMEAIYSYSDNSEVHEYAESIHTNISNLQEGKAAPTLHLIDLVGNSHKIEADDYKTNTVYYFWRLHQNRRNDILRKRIDQLRQQYPDHNFVGINLDNDHDRWVAMVHREQGIPGIEHYRVENFNQLVKLLDIRYLNRMIVIGENGLIVDGFGNIFDEEPLRDKRESLATSVQ
ncbi:TlpA family protein disulfide reductase [Robertkochia aurantiaca]|uniref:TlpA family protein disulfide reductase n=1 Tax=Robertkochia aurantiaca TaxID=2873700 RepID=UPI001CCF51F1|nr:hypothetical protein [Robertkochia sp. 3YJGBD-33]